MARLVFGAVRADENYDNTVLVGKYAVPTRLASSIEGLTNVVGEAVVKAPECCLLLPEHLGSWGMYPCTRAPAWLTTAFIVAFHTTHVDDRGLTFKRAARDAIPPDQWPAIVTILDETSNRFRTNLTRPGLTSQMKFRPLIYLLKTLAPALTACSELSQTVMPSIDYLQKMAVAGHRGELSLADCLAISSQLDTLIAGLAVAQNCGGLENCRGAISRLFAKYNPGRLIDLPPGVSVNAWLKQQVE
jgi:hypothetical protein